MTLPKKITDAIDAHTGRIVDHGERASLEAAIAEAIAQAVAEWREAFTMPDETREDAVPRS